MYFFLANKANPRLVCAATQVGWAVNAAFSLARAASTSLCCSIIAARAKAAAC